MDDENKKLIQEQFAKLPKQLQDAIQSAHVNEQITAIATEHKLHIDQIEVFKNEVTLLMLGFTDALEFVGELKSGLNTDAETSQALATEVNQKILLPIRESMEKTTGEPALAPVPQNNPPAVSMPVADEKSVVMPSAAKAEAPMPVVIPPTPLPVVTPPTTNMFTVPAAPKAAEVPVVPKLDAMLSEPSVSIAPKPLAEPAPAPVAIAPQPAEKVAPPAPPAVHKVDPYREPTD